jgi:hypothetical protein
VEKAKAQVRDGKPGAAEPPDVSRSNELETRQHADNDKNVN